MNLFKTKMETSKKMASGRPFKLNKNRHNALYRKILVVIVLLLFFSFIAFFLFQSQKIQNYTLDSPPWGISFSQLQTIKGPTGQQFETPKIYNYEPTLGLEAVESLWGCNFRALYFFSHDDKRLYKIVYYLDKETIDNASVRHAFEEIKKYVKSIPNKSLFSPCEQTASYRVGSSDATVEEYFTIWEYQDVFGDILYKFCDDPGYETAEIVLSVYDLNNNRNKVEIDQSRRTACLRPVGW